MLQNHHVTTRRHTFRHFCWVTETETMAHLGTSPPGIVGVLCSSRTRVNNRCQNGF